MRENVVRSWGNWGPMMKRNKKCSIFGNDFTLKKKKLMIWMMMMMMMPYTYPRCNSHYCSLHFYKSLVCRIVYARECGGELGQLGPHDETKQKMLDIVKRFHSKKEETDDMDDDDDDADRDVTKSKRVRRSKDLRHT